MGYSRGAKQGVVSPEAHTVGKPGVGSWHMHILPELMSEKHRSRNFIAFM